uniref:TF-B3 domain-containing protein n=1 Tax=Nelumbo nucifera TaxID=4432 RepID=A0A822Y261_NELNU|nr:TPA_asm: hypothetical protein HUJ06_026820 [Nelumbo nucifera]
MSGMMKEGKFWCLSDKPYCHCILSACQLKPRFQMPIPNKFRSMLPSALVPVILIYQNKNWNMLYYGDRALKRFDSTSWRDFAVKNNLMVGDGCVFELLECSSKLIKMRVQILSGEVPYELLKRVSGESFETPIIFD